MQRFSSSLRLHVHFHTLVPDGVSDDEGAFHPLPAPTDAVVERLLARIALRILLEVGAIDDEGIAPDDALLSLEQGSLASIGPASFASPSSRKPLADALEGFSLHAATRVAASDRKGLYRLCRYDARGAVAHSRKSELPDGRFACEMKRALPDGRRRLVMTGTQLLARLTPLIPPP